MITALVSISAGIGGRAAFGLIFAVTVIRHLPSDASMLFFQIILLQSVFINLIGGGGYVRGAGQSGSLAGSVRLLRGFLSTVAVGLSLVWLLASILGLPEGLVAWQLLVLLSSGICTALNAHLMGILSGVAGARRVFLPLALLFAVLSSALLVAPPDGFGAAIIVAAVSQFAPLAMLLMLNRDARTLMRRVVGCHQEKSPESWRPFGNLTIGGAAAGYLLVFYVFREVWSAGVTSEVAAAAFFVFRISETYFQVFSIAAAGVPNLEAWFKKIATGDRTLLTGAVIGVLFFAALQIFTISAIQNLVKFNSIILVFLAMQLACEGLRLGTALVSVVELKSGRTVRFLVLSVAPAIAAAALGIFSAAFSGQAGFFYYQTTFAVLQITGWLLMAGAVLLVRRREADLN